MLISRLGYRTILGYLGRPNVILRVLIAEKGRRRSQRVGAIRKQTAIANRRWKEALDQGMHVISKKLRKAGKWIRGLQKGHSPADILVLTHRRISFWISDFSNCNRRNLS